MAVGRVHGAAAAADAVAAAEPGPGGARRPRERAAALPLRPCRWSTNPRRSAEASAGTVPPGATKSVTIGQKNVTTQLEIQFKSVKSGSTVSNSVKVRKTEKISVKHDLTRLTG